MPVKVDIVLPCYNPNNSWINELISFYEFIKEDIEPNFIVVNDGSFFTNVDSQIQFLLDKKIPITYVTYKNNSGKGYALRQGVSNSKSEFVIYTDIDFPFTNETTRDVISALTSGNYDVVAGYRSEEYYQKKMSSFRKFLSKLFRFFLKDLLKLPITDTQCGLKGFSSKGKEKFLSTHINRYLFDFEFIYAACRDKNITIKTVPVELKDNVVFSKMKLKILFQESLNLLSILIFRRN